MSIHEQIAELADSIRTQSPARTETTFIPAGGAFLDVWWQERFFVLDYSPLRGGFGVDEIREDGTGIVARFGFTDFPSAKKHLLQMLEQAGVPFPKPADVQR